MRLLGLPVSQSSLRKALLLSGGLDSICLAWWQHPDIAFTIDYGQLPAKGEISAATAVAQHLGIQHHVISVDCRSLGSGDLAGVEADPLAPATDWWPFRNQLLVTLAAMRAIRLGVGLLMVGTVRSDETHVDGTPRFVEAMSDLLSLQEGGLTLVAPAVSMTSVELAREANVPAGVLGWAHSCHKAGVACGDCRGCNKYFKVRHELFRDVD